MTKITYIPGEIANAAVDEHGNRKPVTRTQHIFDDAKNKNQAEINAEVASTLASHQSEINTLNNRTNAPDEEDLTSVNVCGTDVLKFKDKSYNPLTYSGMGRKILRKNIVNGVNTLTQDMFYKGEAGSRVPNTNTIFVIQYDFTLGEDITVPANCILQFEGGSLSNGTLVGNDTIIESFTQNIFKDVVFGGTYLGKFYISYYNAQDYSTVLNSLVRSYDTIILDKDIKINNIVIVNGTEKEEICIIGNNITIDAGNLTGPALFWLGDTANPLKNVIIKGITVDYKNNVIPTMSGDAKTYTQGISCNATNLTEVTDVTIENYGRDGAGVVESSFHAIRLRSRPEGVVKVENIRCINLVVTGDGEMSVGYGECYGVVVVYKDENSEFGQGYINNILCSNIKSINSEGVEIFDDATGIYIQGYKKNCSIPITNCKFINNTKRAIKIQANGVLISNILLLSDFEPANIYNYTAINIQGDNSRITNVKGSYNGLVTIISGNGNHVVENVDVDIMDSLYAFCSPCNMVTFKNCVVKSNNATFFYMGNRDESFGNFTNSRIVFENCYFHGKDLLYLDSTVRAKEYNIDFINCCIEAKYVGDSYLGTLSFTRTKIYPLDTIPFINNKRTSFINSEFHLDYVETHENDPSFNNHFLIVSNSYLHINGLKVYAANHIHIDLIWDIINENGGHIEGVEVLKIDETEENHGKIRTLGGYYTADGVSTFGDLIFKDVKAASSTLLISAKLHRVFFESLKISAVYYLEKNLGSPNFVGKYTNCNPSVSGDSVLEGCVYLINNNCHNYICISNSAGNMMQFIPNTDYDSKLFHSTTRPPLNSAGSAGFQMHDDSIDKDIMWNGERWVDNFGFTAALGKGETTYRPKGIGATGGVLDPTKDIGYNYYDTTIKKPIYASVIAVDGTVTWVDATGTPV